MIESDKNKMNEYYTSYRTALIVCIIIFVAYLSGILAATINTSKKGLTINSPKEELDEEDNLFIPLYTGFVTFVVIATISLSHFKKKGTSGYYDMKASEASEVRTKIEKHSNEYKNHLENIGGSDPISNSGSLDEKFFLKMPYYDSLVIICLGLLLSSFFGIFLFKRAIFCKRQCYAGKSNRCCSTHLMCPNKNNIESQLDYDIDLNLDFVKGKPEDQLITIDRGTLKKGNKPLDDFYIDIRRGTSSGMTNILGDINMYGCCCSNLSGGVSGVSFYIPPEPTETNYGNITQLLVECVGNNQGGLCSSTTVATNSVNPKFYVNVDGDTDPTGFFIGYKQGTDSLENSSTGISTSNPDGIVQQLKNTNIPFISNEKNLTETKNLFPDFLIRHISVNKAINSSTVNEEIKNKKFTSNLICIDPGFRYISCDKVKPVPFGSPDYGPSSRFELKNPSSGRQFFPACFDYSGSNSQINATNNGNGNFETIASRVFGKESQLNQQATPLNPKGGKGSYTGFIVGNNALVGGGTKINTYNYNSGAGKYELSTLTSGVLSADKTTYGQISANTHRNPYTNSATFCFRTDGGACYDPLFDSAGGNPSNNKIASSVPLDKNPSDPEYYKTNAPNAFRTAPSANSKTTEFHMGFNHDPPRKGFFSNLFN